MSYTKRQIEEYQKIESKFLDLFYNYPKTTSTEIRVILDKLHRYETTLHRISENECNGHPKTITEYRDGKMYRYDVENIEWSKRDEKKEKSIQEKVITLLSPYNIKVQFSGDPRGGSIRMKLPDNSSNGWDGETWGIYW